MYLCTDMKTIDEILREIVLSGLIAPTPSQVAAATGYKGRSTVIRIIKGTAKRDAIANFCDRLREHFGLSEADLRHIYESLKLSKAFARQCELTGKDFDSILTAAVDGDLTCFEPILGSDEYASLLRMRRDKPEQFVTMLSFVYFKNPDATIDSLISLLRKAFAGNAVGTYIGTVYSDFPVARSRRPRAIKDIETGAMIIRCFCDDYTDLSGYRHMNHLRGIGVRSYWTEHEAGRIALLRAVNIEQGCNAYYELFYIYGECERLENPAQLYFLDNGLAACYLKESRRTSWAHYSATEQAIELSWIGVDGLHSTSKLDRLDRANSRSLRDIDKSLSDSQLYLCSRTASGIIDLPTLKVKDVSTSRSTVTLHLTNGSNISLDRSLRRFMAEITPDMDVAIYRDATDNIIYAEWPTLGNRIPLDPKDISNP